MIRYFLFIVLVVSAIASCSRSVAPEYEDENTIVWRKKNSPIIVDTLVHVKKEQTLIIEKGVEVLLKSALFYYDEEDSLGIAQPVYYLYDMLQPRTGLIRIDGKLFAKGTVSEPIVFTRKGIGFWGTIYADSCSVIELENCHISYFAGFFDWRYPEYRPIGVFMNNSSGKIVNCDFFSEQRTISIELNANSNPLIRGNRIESHLESMLKTLLQ
ncbi:MAG: right-handed parallel beta-helix repeat-containing protein [Candidatus Cloacimonetes bacterium]|nr:right-handed parallel beta-helix repeat-containing protein [Candidatus Cloacimonadota bacterium]